MSLECLAAMNLVFFFKILPKIFILDYDIIIIKSSLSFGTQLLLIVFGFDQFHARRFFVLVEIGLEGESFSASGAGERLEVGMSLDVGSQV